MKSKKVSENVNEGLWAGSNNNGLIAVVFKNMETGMYIINYHHGEMPAHASDVFETQEELEVAMRMFHPDFRKWHTKFLGG